MSYTFDDEGNKKYTPANYVQRYYEDIFLDNLENAHDNSLISHDDEFLDYVKSKQDISNFYVMNLSVISDGIDDVYYDMTDVYYSNKVDYAIEDDLDSIGDTVGCLRPEATYASVLLTFTTDNYAIVKTIPEGLIVSNDEGVSYVTVDEVDLPPYTTEIDIQAFAVEPGMGSRVLAGTLTKIVSDTTEESIGINIKSVTNKSNSSGGVNSYTDKDYRNLILNHRKENIRGTVEAFEKFFADYDGLNSWNIIPNWNGTGTVKIVLDPGTPYQLNDVYTQIKESVTQIDDDINMFSFEPVPINIYATCNVDIDLINPYSSIEKEAIKSRIVDAIKLYIEGNVTDYTGLSIGEDFVPYQLGVFLKEEDLIPELKNIVFEYPTAPITIEDEQKGVANDIIIEME